MKRQYWIDNLRAYVIILVILVHTGVTYSGIGGWYYIENSMDNIDTLSTAFFGFFSMHAQAYFMGILFLIAGYFTISSYNKEGFTKYIKSRFIRLGIPTLIYMFIINPFIIYCLLNINNSNIFESYDSYIRSFYFLEGTGPLWFTAALLIFSIIYALSRKLFNSKNNKVITKIKDSTIIKYGLIITLITYLVRIIYPFGTSVYNMQLCFFTQYIFFFIFGIIAFKNDLFNKINPKQGNKWLLIGTIGSFISWIIVIIVSGSLSGNSNSILGGGTWQSLLYSFWEMFTGISMTIGLIYLFKNKYQINNKKTEFLTKNAFAVYVFHPIILISLSLLFKSIHLYPIIKFILVGWLAIFITYLLAEFIIRKIPLLNKVMK